MSSDNVVEELKSDELWLKIINEGVEDRVEVNQRMLIDKMLARYSSDFVVYRELIQNSDDAQSSSFTLELTCDRSTSTFNYESINKTSSTSFNQRAKNPILEGISQLLKNPFNLNSNSSDQSNDLSRTNLNEDQYNNCLISEIRTINNGNIFSEDDWKRVITIAEGNTNVEAIGQFGVGFFSVFSYSEKPMIKSGKHCLAFVWKNGKSLTTFRKELNEEEQKATTSIILSMKNKFILQTQNHFNKNDLFDQNRIAKAKKNTRTNEIVPTLDLTQLKAYFTKVLSFTKYINELIIQINGEIIFKVYKRIKPIQSNKLFLAPKTFNSNNEHNLLQFNSFKQTEQIFSIENGPQIHLFHIDVQAKVTIDKEFQLQMERLLKKSLPSTIHIQFLFPSYNIFEEEQWKMLKGTNINNQILKELIPLKFDDETINPSGQIFIGLATHQTTGIGMHVFTHLIPTIERENIDLQDPYISIWNEQLLTSIGKIVRFIYDQTILHVVNNITQQSNLLLNHVLSPYAFQTSAPNKDIGRLILDGFFSSDKDILVPVKRSPSDVHLSLIPSTEAFISNSKYIERFLPVPLVPYEIGKHDFLKTLKRRNWIEEITNEIVLIKIHESILSFDELIGLLRWLCTNDINKNKSYIKNILSKLEYRENGQNEIIKLEKVEYYDSLNLPYVPLPKSVFPSSVVAHISREDLHKRLLLSSISIKYLIEFYLMEKQHLLFNQEKTSPILLSFLSERWNQLNNEDIKKIPNVLSNLQCIPTSKGMKLPNESYIRSTNLSLDLPIINLYIPQIDQSAGEYPVSMEFLKLIGCRSIYVPTATNQKKNFNDDQDIFQTNESFLTNLLERRKYLSDNDLNALIDSQCLVGTTFESDQSKKAKYKPYELHFPSVSQRLDWKDLLILDWPEIDPRSREYSFLKELGVKEVPQLNQLIWRIEQEHEKQPKNLNEYQIPKAIFFFAENFQQFYSKTWKNSNIQSPFLPSTLPNSNEVILTNTQFVFKESNPFFASLLVDVIRCFSLYIDIHIIGVKHRPTISMAFNYLIERRNQLLNVQTAPNIFSYLNKLEGLNKTFIQHISKLQFIPLQRTNEYVKVHEVFIRSKTVENHLENEEVTRGLIDYVDYGYEANSFLTTIGVLAYPTALNLANLLIDKQEKYFKDNQNLEAKLKFYTNCLKQLSISANLTQQLNVEPLKTRLKSQHWCLAYQTNENKQTIFKIVKPSDVYLDDDHQSHIDIKPLCAPDEPELIKLYEHFGAKWLSEHVQRTLIHRGNIYSTERTKKLFNLINDRLDMLFVNNRGERLDNLDEKRFQLLKTNLSVYESDQIICQIHFQNQTILLNSSECSSCALEHEKKKVVLYIERNLSTIDYIDISIELTRYVFKKAHDQLVHSISDKLSSPLETLKRRGIPVDRLLKTKQQQTINLTVQPQQQQQQNSYQENNQQKQISEENFAGRVEQSKQVPREENSNRFEQNDGNSHGFFQSLRDLLNPFQYPLTPPRTNSIENVQSDVQINRVKDFGTNKSSDENEINRMISLSRPYTKTQFNQSESRREEINNSCEFIPQANLIRYENLLNGIQLFIDKNVQLTDKMIEQGKQLAYLLSSLATQVFHLPVQTIHLFRDIDSARIAFNSNGSLFYNLRYFEQVYGDELNLSISNGLLSSKSSSIVRKVVNFYFMVSCHELSHNIDSNHDLNFINRLENVSVQFMDQKDQFLSKFSF